MAWASANTIPNPSEAPESTVTLGTQNTRARFIQYRTTPAGWVERKLTSRSASSRASLLEARPQRPVSDDHQPTLGMRPLHQSHGVQQLLASFVLDQPADEQHRVANARPTGRE